MRRSSRLPLLSLALSATFLVGCPDNAGNPPPADHLFYPIAAVVAGTDARPFLYVVNSNFDLKYNGSTVVAIDLAPLRNRARDPANCAPDTESLTGAQVCRDSEFITERFTRKLNPFAIDAAAATYTWRDSAGTEMNARRLYVLVRGGNSLSWFDLNPDGSLDCGAPPPSGGVVESLCAARYQAGTDSAQSEANTRLPFDPSALSIDPGCGWITVTHQSTDPNLPRATLFRDSIYDGRTARASAAPKLINVVGNLAPGLSSLALLTPTASPGGGLCPESSRSTWIATSRSDPSFTFLQAYPGNRTLSDRAYLYRSNAVNITGLNTGSDSRDIALDPTPGQSRAFVVSRRPEALLTVDLRNPNAPTVTDAVALPYGPSRLAVAPGTASHPTLVYVVSYEARAIAVVDPAEHRIIDQIPTHAGPHDIVRDPNGEFLYVVDFLDASLEVIDIRPTSPRYNRRVLTLARQEQ